MTILFASILLCGGLLLAEVARVIQLEFVSAKPRKGSLLHGCLTLDGHVAALASFRSGDRTTNGPLPDGSGQPPTPGLIRLNPKLMTQPN